MKKVVLLVFLTVLIVTCKKKDEVQPQPSPVANHFSLSAASAAPWQIVMIESEQDVFNNDKYIAQIGTHTLNLARIDANTLAFMIPSDLTAGRYSIKAQLPGGDNSFDMDVKPAPTPLTASEMNAIVNEIKMNADELVIQADSMVKAGWMKASDKQAIERIKDSITLHLQQFQNASPEAQQAALAYLAANRYVYDKLDDALAGYSTFGVNKKGPGSFLSFAADFGANAVVPIVGMTAIGIVVASAATPAMITAAAVGGSIALGTYIGWNIEKDMLKAPLSKLNNLLKQFNHKKEIPEQITADKTTFTSGTTEDPLLTVTQRTVQETDKNSTSNLLKGYVENFNKFKKEWKGEIATTCGEFGDFLLDRVKSVPRKLDRLAAKIIGNDKVTVTVSGTDEPRTTFKTADGSTQQAKCEYTYQIEDFQPVTITKDITIQGAQFIYRSIEKTLTTTYDDGSSVDFSNYDNYVINFSPQVGEPALESFSINFSNLSYLKTTALHDSWITKKKEGVTVLDYMSQSDNVLFPQGTPYQKNSCTFTLFGIMQYSENPPDFRPPSKYTTQTNVEFSEQKFPLYLDSMGAGIHGYIHTMQYFFESGNSWIDCGGNIDVGLPLNTSTCYLPFVLKDASNKTYWGWIRISTNGYNSFTIHDMAINVNPNQPIKTGQK